MTTPEHRLSVAIWDWIESEDLHDEPAEELHIDLMDYVLRKTDSVTREPDYA